MSLIRLVIIVLAIWLIYRLVVRVLSRPAQRKVPQGAAQDMVKCAHCGVHLPGEQAVIRGEHNYCSVEHSQAGPSTEEQ